MTSFFQNMFVLLGSWALGHQALSSKIRPFHASDKMRTFSQHQALNCQELSEPLINACSAMLSIDPLQIPEPRNQPQW